MSTVNDNITQDKIKITTDLVKIGIMVNAGISAVIIIVLLVLVSGPGGAKSQISKASDFFSTPCIPTGNGSTGFKQIAGGKIKPCDPSGNDSTPDILKKLLNGSASADLSGNSLNVGKILITIGVISNILFIFCPYLAFIPRNIWLWILRKKAEKTVDDQLNRTKEPIKVAEEILKIDPKDTAEARRKLSELREKDINRQFQKEIGKTANNIDADPSQSQFGGGKEYFKFVTHFAGFIGGNKCDSGEAQDFS